MKFKKIIVWGAKLDTGHTHAFIHEACVRAGNYLQIPTFWLDNRDNIDNSFFDNALVITEQWLVFQNPYSNNMPLNKSAIYFIHYLGNKGQVEGNPGINMYLGKVKKVIDFRFNAEFGWGINGEIDKNYSYAFEKNKYEKISDVSFYEKNSDYDKFYSIWATDLLPNEFRFDDRLNKKNNNAFFCGTIRDDNAPLFEGFINKCKTNNTPFIYNNPWSRQMQTEEIRKNIISCMFPLDIRPKNHLANGYIACRPIKNASYGALPVTNSKSINDFFNGECAFSNNSEELYEKILDMQNNKQTEKIILNHMINIKNNHTYVNRIKDILKVAEL